MLARRKSRRHRAGKKRTTKKTKHAKQHVSGPSTIILAKGLPKRPKGYLTYQKGTTLVAKKLNRKGGKKGRRVCRAK